MEITYSYKLCAIFYVHAFYRAVFIDRLLFLFRIGLQHYGEMVTLRMHAMPKRPPSVPTQLQKFDEYPQVNSLNCTYSDEAHANRVYLYSTFEIFENGYNFISSISKNCRVLPQARNCMYKVLIKKKSDTLNLNIFF